MNDHESTDPAPGVPDSAPFHNADSASSGPSFPLAVEHSALRRVVRLARKELREILRDRRTIVTLIAMPILLYPLMSVAFQQFYLASRDLGKTETKYRVGVLTDTEGLVIKRRLTEGEIVLLRDQKDFADDKKSKAHYLPTVDVLRVPDRPEPVNAEQRAEALKNLENLLQNSAIDLIAVFPDREALAPAAKDRWLACQILSVANSFRGRQALGHVETLLAAANEEDLKKRLDLPGVPRITGMSIEPISLKAIGGDGIISLSALVPLILILMTITGAVYPAIDLTAGERERGTLEILVAAPVSRFELLTAKYISVVTVAVLTAIVNLVCMTITLRWSGLGELLIKGGMSLVLLMEIFGLLLLFAAFFSAVLLCLTSFARSFKEAQAYLIPLMLAALTPGILAMLPGLHLEGVLLVLPLVNVVLLARDLFGDGTDLFTAAVVIMTTLLYALAALSLAARVFGAESVLYNEQSGWSDLLRRPDRPQHAASIPALLWCLALMVPIQFALIAALRVAGPFPPALNLVLSVIVNLLLFGLLPALFIFLGRVELVNGLSLTMARPAAWIGAGLLGASLWPIQLWLLSMSHATSGLEERLGRVAEEMTRARESIGWGALIAVIVPAILEEIFFRGLLFNALKARSGALMTIGVSGLLFGLAHVVVDGALGLERFIPTTVLGLILGAVRWQTGSLWPGMLQHVLHNALLVGVGLGHSGSLETIPAEWLAAGSAGSLIGAALVWQAGRNGAALPIAQQHA